MEEWILGKYGGGCGLDSAGSEQGSMTGCWEHGNETSCSRKGGEFLD